MNYSQYLEITMGEIIRLMEKSAENRAAYPVTPFDPTEDELLEIWRGLAKAEPSPGADEEQQP